MTYKGTYDPFDLNGDGVVDIADLTIAIQKLDEAKKLVDAMKAYLYDDGPAPVAKPFSIEVTA